MKMTVVLALICVTFGLAVAQDSDAAVKRYQLDIPQQTLDAALKDLAQQTGLQIARFTDNGHGSSMVGPVRGNVTAETALDSLLAQTGLEYSFINDRTVAVASVQKVAEEGGDSELGNGRTAGATPKPVMMAQAAAKQSQTSRRTETDSDKNEKRRPLEEIVVTGTNIRGAVPVGSPLFEIDREEIDRAGFSTTQQIIQSLPQNFGGGISEDSSGSFNQDGSSGINLRGLGNLATLTLLNGRRLPLAGTEGNLIDVSTIPASLIERIEILSDGASAIYGADAIAGVVNIILREDFEGAETRLRFGTVTDGGLGEYQVSQTVGTDWNTGNAMVAYEYYKRDPLFHADRKYTATSDLTPLGGDNLNNTFFSNPGNILDFSFTPAFAIPTDQDGTNLTVADLVSIPPGQPNELNFNAGNGLLPEQDRHSAFVSARQQLTDYIELFEQGSYAKRNYTVTNRGIPSPIIVPDSNPFFVDPFGGAPFLIIGYDFADDLGQHIITGDVEEYSGAIGATVELWDHWQATTFGAYSKRTREFISTDGGFDSSALSAALADPNPLTAFNPFGEGSNTNPETIDAIRTIATQNTSAEVSTANLTINGTLFTLPAGNVALAAGLEYREESLGNISSGTGRDTTVQHLKKDLTALFGELQLPLFSSANRVDGLEQLILSASVRHENYGGLVRENSANPKFGFLWAPVEGLNVRGSYGTSFRTPNLSDLDTSGGLTSTSISNFPDPASPTGTTLTIHQSGNNADLDDETARTWTAGFDYLPPTIPDLSVELTYFNINFEDRIARPRPTSIVLANEDQFADRVIRNPTQVQLDIVCNSEFFIGDPATCVEGTIGLIIDFRLNNTASTRVSGFDFAARYSLDIDALGYFDFRVNGSYLLNFKEAFTPTSRAIELVDTISNPVDFRMRSSVRWSNASGLSAIAFVTYADGYLDNVSSPQREVDSWKTVDLNLTYNTQERFRSIGLNDTKFSLSVQNIFDADPPFVNNIPLRVGYDPANADPLGRFISLDVIKSW